LVTLLKPCARLGWQPQITVEQMCAEMVACDLAAAKTKVLLIVRVLASERVLFGCRVLPKTGRYGEM
jgi:hypothetical protein